MTIFFGLLILILTAKSQASGLYGECKTDENCGTFDTFCKNGTCICKQHFAPLFDTCIHLAKPPIKCTKRHECQTTLGSKGVCKDHKCGCKSFHHLHDGMCVKSRGVEEVCEFDHQCYCGQNCQQGIECFQKICTCKTGYVQESRKCISIVEPSSTAQLPPQVIPVPSLAESTMISSSSSSSTNAIILIAINFLYLFIFLH